MPPIIDWQAELIIREGAEGLRLPPSEIHKLIVEAARGQAWTAPSLRTVERKVNEYRGKLDSETWALEDGPADEIRHLLDAMRTSYASGQGPLALGDATWLVRIHKAAPDLPMDKALDLARFYRARSGRDEPTADLDAYLAFCPWENGVRARQYWALVAEGTVPNAPALIGGPLLLADKDQPPSRGLADGLAAAREATRLVLATFGRATESMGQSSRTSNVE